MTLEPPGTDDVPASADRFDSTGEADERVNGHRSPWSWKKVVTVAAGGAAATIAGTVVATLAATHRSAVAENAAAYANGISDALQAVRDGFDPSDI